jgi:membrane associated rhomboid family serine protease
MSSIDIQNLLDTGSYNSTIIESISKTKISDFYATYHTPAVGASGAVYGVLVAFAMYYPNSKLALIFFPVPIAAKYFIPIIILGDLFFGVTKYSVGNIAHFAHIGGALIGFIIAWQWKQHQFKRWN